MKEKIELQVLLKTSPKILESKIATTSGLSEWFCDDVNIREGIYYFKWDSIEEDAVLIEHKPQQFIRFQWLADRQDGLDTYFEIATQIDALTSEITLTVVDFCEPQERQNNLMLWQQQINQLRRLIGC
jgi:hypothetical protein